MYNLNKTTWDKAINLLLRVQQHNTSHVTWKSSPNAPDMQEMIQEFKETKTIHVWDGASETAIFGSQGNIIFRVWHDSLHIKLGASFSPEGEYEVLLEHQRQVVEYVKFNPQFRDVMTIALELLRYELIGQRAYFELNNKEYLEQQGKFAKYMLNGFIQQVLNYKE